MGTGKTFQSQRAKARAGGLAGKGTPSSDLATLGPRPTEAMHPKVRNLDSGLKSERIKSPASFQGPGAKLNPSKRGRWTA